MLLFLGSAKRLIKTELELKLANLPSCITVTSLKKRKSPKANDKRMAHQHHQFYSNDQGNNLNFKPMTKSMAPPAFQKLANPIQNAANPFQRASNSFQAPLMTIKSEPVEEKFEFKPETGEDIWPMVASSQTKVHIDELLRKGIKREALPFEMQDFLQMLLNNVKPMQPPCGCLQIGQSKLFLECFY